MRPLPTIALPVLLLTAAACGGEGLQASTQHSATDRTTNHTKSVTHKPAVTHTRTSTATKARVNTAADVHRTVIQSTPMCTTGGLSLRLGHRGSAAGSQYQPIVFTNTTQATCSLTGYPGVSFVAPSTGHQVGAAASRNPQHATTTVMLAPGASASALLQIVDHANYPPARCNAARVSGLRVYPPGNTAAAYVPFHRNAHTACSSQVEQLAVDAVVTGSAGQ